MLFSLAWGHNLEAKAASASSADCVAATESTIENIQNAVLPKESAEKFGELCILYNDRISPLQTYALDFCKKIYGSRCYKGLTAEQVLSGWIFYGDVWSQEPFIKIKSGEFKSTLALPDYCTLNQFFNRDMRGYTIGQYVQEYYNGAQDKFHQQAADIDSKIQLIMELRQGISLKVLPYTFTKNVKATKNNPFFKAGDHHLVFTSR